MLLEGLRVALEADTVPVPRHPVHGIAGARTSATVDRPARPGHLEGPRGAPPLRWTTVTAMNASP
jgi:hypothetical protein